MMEWHKLLSRERSYQKSTIPTDRRNPFENDYQRVILSPSFRRLQDKTQVFPLENNDFIRTRLTHSLEVSTIAKSLGSMVGTMIVDKNLNKKFTVKEAQQLSDLLACTGLLHDIGNPPFGHFGEKAIGSWFAKNLNCLKYNGKILSAHLNEQQINDLTQFEGNAQALRVITKIHHLYCTNDGINLTYATMGSLIKYPHSSLTSKKFGYFFADRKLFTEIQSEVGLNNNRHPAVFLLEAADDISYLLADIEDALEKDIITFEDVEISIKKASAANEATYLDKVPKDDANSPDNLKFQRWANLTLRGLFINKVATRFIQHYDEIMAGEFKKSLLEASSISNIVSGLRAVCYKRVFPNRDILKIELSGKNIIFGLLDLFIPAILTYDSSIPNKTNEDEFTRLITLISNNCIKAYEGNSRSMNDEEKVYLRLLIVTDFICGMTDNYAKQLYQELKGIS